MCTGGGGGGTQVVYQQVPAPRVEDFHGGAVDVTAAKIANKKRIMHGGYGRTYAKIDADEITPSSGLGVGIKQSLGL